MFFLGRYEHSLDPKQRLAIPAEFRDLIQSKDAPKDGPEGVHKPASETSNEVMIAAPGSNGSLWLWPEQTFHRMAVSLNGSLLGHKDVQRLGRSFFSKAARLPIDGAGRVRIPDRLLQEYGLSGSVMILGVGDHLELCRPEVLAAEEATRQGGDDEMWDRAREVMGGGHSR